MRDIVERLRDACVIDPNYGKSVRLTLDYNDCMEAADEIEYLRATLREIVLITDRKHEAWDIAKLLLCGDTHE